MECMLSNECVPTFFLACRMQALALPSCLGMHSPVCHSVVRLLSAPMHASTRSHAHSAPCRRRSSKSWALLPSVKTHSPFCYTTYAPCFWCICIRRRKTSLLLGYYTPGTMGHRLRSKHLNMIDSLQRKNSRGVAYPISGTAPSLLAKEEEAPI
jgi:hypothetical protein